MRGLGSLLLLPLQFVMVFGYPVLGVWGLVAAFGWLGGLAFAILPMCIGMSIQFAIGVFAFAVVVLDWHWFFAALLAAPQIVFMLIVGGGSLLAGAFTGRPKVARDRPIARTVRSQDHPPSI